MNTFDNVDFDATDVVETIEAAEAFDEIDNAGFDGMGLPPLLLNSLKAMKFSTPTPIQAKAIPDALLGRDLLGSAQTGTGKTGAFGIPLVAKLLNEEHSTALILAPTRELANQVCKQIDLMLSKKSGIKTALLIGGESMQRQISMLGRNPRVFVGTPGRIIDHLNRGILSLHDTSFLVLDETDRMLDMGFSTQIEEIIKHTPEKRQTLLFSATFPKNIVKLTERYLKDPVQVSANPVSSASENIIQEHRHVSDAEKYPVLCEELESREGTVVVFVKTKHGADRMAHRLHREGHSAVAIHGNLKQNKRDRVIDGFRKQKHRILVATDVAARGLDIPHIAHVINYDLPQASEDYIHRIGRTARAGGEGHALSLITPSTKNLWAQIVYLLDPTQKPPKAEGGKKRRSGGRGRQNNAKHGYAGRRSQGDGYAGRQGDGYDGNRGYGSDRGNRRRDADGERRRFQQRDGQRSAHQSSEQGARHRSGEAPRRARSEFSGHVGHAKPRTTRNEGQGQRREGQRRRFNQN